jgi:SulP family sulfate permease
MATQPAHTRNIVALLQVRWPAIFNLPVVTINIRFGGIPQAFHEWPFRNSRRNFAPAALRSQCVVGIESCSPVADSAAGDRLIQARTGGAGVNVLGAVFGEFRPPAIAPPLPIFVQRAYARRRHDLRSLLSSCRWPPLARFIPLATLAAVLLVVAYNMGDGARSGPSCTFRRGHRGVVDYLPAVI